MVRSFSLNIVSFVTDLFTLVESWEQKGKFPPSLKPPLANLAILAIKLDEYDDDFFSLMPMLFPYNKFTMTVRYYLFTWGLCIVFNDQHSEIYQANNLRGSSCAID